MAIYMVADTPEELRDIIVEELEQEIKLLDRRIATYTEAVEHGGKVPGVVSGVRKRDLVIARAEAGALRLFLLRIRDANIVPHAKNPTGAKRERT